MLLEGGSHPQRPTNKLPCLKLQRYTGTPFMSHQCVAAHWLKIAAVHALPTKHVLFHWTMVSSPDVSFSSPPLASGTSTELPLLSWNLNDLIQQFYIDVREQGSQWELSSDNFSSNPQVRSHKVEQYSFSITFPPGITETTAEQYLTHILFHHSEGYWGD